MSDLDYLFLVVWPEIPADLLVPETEPRRIVLNQRIIVGQAVYAVGLDVAAISRRVCLPEWSVWKRLKELGYDVPDWIPAASKAHKGRAPVTAKYR